MVFVEWTIVGFEFSNLYLGLIIYHFQQKRTNWVLYINMVDLKKIIGQHNADFQLQSNQLTINLRRQKDQFLLTTTISDDKLPQSFLNIFDSVSELFAFIKSDGKVQIQDQILILVVKIIKVRHIKIELNKVPLPKINIVQEKIDKLQVRTSKIQQYINQSLTKLCQKYVEEYSKKTIKALSSEVKKLNDRVAALQQINKKLSNKDLASHSHTLTHPPASLLPKSGEKVNSNVQESKPKANKQGQNPFLILYQQKINNPLGKIFQKPVKTVDFHFDIDTNNKYIEYFSIVQSVITRLKEDQQLYMLSSSNHIPQTDRHSFKIKINQITDGLIWIGLIVPKKKSEQYIGEEKDIIQFCLDGSKCIIDGKIINLSFSQFKEGDIAEMVVQIGKKRVQFFKNGRLSPLYEITIPQSMRGVPLYPYVQMINQGDSITLL